MTAHTLPSTTAPPPGADDPLAVAMADPALSWAARGVLAFLWTRPVGRVMSLRAILGVSPAAAADASVEGAITEISTAGYQLRGPAR